MRALSREECYQAAGGFDWVELAVVVPAYAAVGVIQGALLALFSKEDWAKAMIAFGVSFGLLGAAQNIVAQNRR